MKTTQIKRTYLSPSAEEIELFYEGCLCSSPEAGGSEGTEEEPLFP